MLIFGKTRLRYSYNIMIRSAIDNVVVRLVLRVRVLYQEGERYSIDVSRRRATLYDRH